MSQQAVFVTGASSGIGEACALSLASRGWQVFAGVRHASDGQKLVGKAVGNQLTPVILDVTKNSAIVEAARQIRYQLGARGLAGLVNNAGIAVAGPMEFIPIDKLREQMDVNFIGQVMVTQEFLPLLRRESGRIVNMSSISGRIAFPLLGPYAASKHALEAFTDSLRVELRPWHIHVASVEPGAVSTPIWQKARQDNATMLETMPAQTLELYDGVISAMFKRIQPNQGIATKYVVNAVVHALTAKRPKARYVVGREAKISLWLNRLPVRWRDWLIARSLG
ncbi:MAG: SDR family oxidoreductase [Anaerolineales bacterium]|nr:SDR family oxidoreductase [Anaerolineales bacterium]